MTPRIRNVLLVSAAAGIALLAIVSSHPGQGFTGSDERACALVGTLRPGYRPWLAPFWSPPGAEIESLLFALQAAAGTGILCYALGYWRGCRKARGERDA